MKKLDSSWMNEDDLQMNEHLMTSLQKSANLMKEPSLAPHLVPPIYFFRPIDLISYGGGT
jgi:5-methylthioribose kinase